MILGNYIIVERENKFVSCLCSVQNLISPLPFKIKKKNPIASLKNEHVLSL